MDFPAPIQIQETLRFKASVAIYALVINPRGELEKNKNIQNKTNRKFTYTPESEQTSKQILIFSSTRPHFITSLLWSANFLGLEITRSA